MKKLSLLLLIMIPLISYNQISIRGIVLSKNDSTPIPYVNIGIKGKNIGTVSDDKGKFNLQISSNYIKDSLFFSSIGYESQNISIEDCKKQINNNVFLNSKIYNIAEVEIVPRNRYKTKQFGGKLSWGIPSSYEIDQLGHELGVIVDLKGNRSKLSSFSFFLSQTECDTILFRINVYNVNNLVPEDKILKKNIYVMLIDRKGLVSINLEEYNIIAENDFAITLEWLKDYNKACIYFRAKPGLLTLPVLTKETSQGEWNVSTKIGMDFIVTVKQL